MDLREETVFWTRQFSEHLLFLGQMLQGDLGAEALQRHEEYEAMRQAVSSLDGPAMASAVEDATRSTYLFQSQICTRLEAGEWLGFAWPLFCDHITREVELYMRIAYGDRPPPGEIAAVVSQMGGEHALFASQLIDPSVRVPSRIAKETGWQLISLSEKEQTKARLLAEVALQKVIKQFVETTGLGTPQGVKSLVSLTLRDHVLREQDYYADKVSDALRQGDRA